MNVWVPGGSGMLGSAVCRALARRGIAHVASGRAVDLADATAVRAFAARVRPSHVINCAAFTQVDACETADAATLAVNASGPGHLGAAAAAHGAAACHVSTDYVFDGSAHAPYDETTPCAPVSAYGRSKLAGERAFAAAAPGGGTVVRTAWLFGHGGRHFVATMLRLMAARATVSVVADQQGAPTYCDDLAAALVALMGLGERPPAAPGTYHAVNAGATTWHGLASAARAEALARGTALACEQVQPIATAAYPTPARRPAYSVLATDKLAAALGAPLRPWQQGLGAYMDGWANGRG